MEKVKFTWNQFDIAVRGLANALPKDFDQIYGIPRGGLVLAVVLSHLTGKPLTTQLGGSSLLVVDDISDSGKTLAKYAQLAKYTATIHYVHDSIFEPTVWVSGKLKQTWIVYPWEEMII